MPFDGPTRAMLHALRWRKPPRDHRRLWTAMGIALALHVFFGAVVWYEMKPPARRPEFVEVKLNSALQIRFIARQPARELAAPPPLAPPPPSRPIREPVSKSAMTVHMPGPAPVPVSASSAPHPALFSRTGQIILPAGAPSAAPTQAGYVQRVPQGDAQIMQDRAGNQYKSAPNRFEKYFPPPKESFVGGLMRKLNGSQSNTKSVDLPHGIHLKCQKVFGIPIPNCGIPPAPPPPTDGDERLNMAPPPLVKGTPMPKPGIAACIADYQAGKPLPYGCPVDTPARAVKSSIPHH